MAARLATPLATLGLLLRTCIWPPAPCLLGSPAPCLRVAIFLPTGFAGQASDRHATRSSARNRAGQQAVHSVKTFEANTRCGRGDGVDPERGRGEQTRQKQSRRGFCAVKGSMRWPRDPPRRLRLRPPLPGPDQTEGQRLHAGCAVRRPCSPTGSGARDARYDETDLVLTAPPPPHHPRYHPRRPRAHHAHRRHLPLSHPRRRRRVIRQSQKGLAASCAGTTWTEYR